MNEYRFLQIPLEVMTYGHNDLNNEQSSDKYVDEIEGILKTLGIDTLDFYEALIDFYALQADIENGTVKNSDYPKIPDSVYAYLLNFYLRLHPIC